jgi:hypothetical protein
LIGHEVIHLFLKTQSSADQTHCKVWNAFQSQAVFSAAENNVDWKKARSLSARIIPGRSYLSAALLTEA